MNSSKSWSGIVFAFVVGVIVGGVVMMVLARTHVVHVIRGGRPPLQEVIGKRVTENLGLNADERAKLSQILDEYAPAFQALRDSSRVEIQKTADRMEARIREILTPEQQAKFDLNVSRIHEDLRKHRERERAEAAERRGGSPPAR